MSTIQYHSAKSGYTATGDVMLIADEKAIFASLTLDSLVIKAASITSAADLTLLQSVAERLSPGTDDGSAVEFYIASADSKVKRVVLAALATAKGRSNTPSRSHSLSALVNSNKGSKDLSILVLSSHRDHAYPQGIAVGRCFPLYSLKSKKADPVKIDVVVFQDDIPSEDVFVKECTHTVGAIRLAQRLVDMPPNELHTDAYVEEVKRVVDRIGCKVHIISGKQLEEQGLGGIWGVGKASEHLPSLVILSHVPEGKEGEESVCCVGKGIVYDTGGLSIKISGAMAGMKHDMGGSAAMLGAFETAVLCGVDMPIHAVLCLAENSVGPLATRPDDVHKFLSGKTVEVNNTDAEGRLVLGDGCFYASKFLKPKYIIDMATLTGAQLISTGKTIAALYCNDDDLESAAVAVGKLTGDLTHPLPYCPEFFRGEFKSQVADFKNSVKDRGNAQSSCAGQFIGNHIEDYLKKHDSNKFAGRWLHIDMAGPVSINERATGYGVALVFKLIQAIASKSFNL